MTPERARFVKLATQRVNKAIKHIRLIGNLSNEANYVYTQDDVQRLFKALDTGLKASRRKFREANKPALKFKL